MTLGLERSIKFGDLVLTDYPFLTEFGMDYAAGDLVTSVLSSFLQDGDLEMSQRRGNMTLTIPLLVEGTDLLELAQAEAALAIEAQKPTNTLTINPGDGFGPPTVFDTFEADVSFSFDDKLEQATLRRIVLTMRALPFGRSLNSVAAVAVGPNPSSATEVVINDGSSAAGWTGTNNRLAVTPTSDGSSVSVTGPSAASGSSSMTYAGPIDLTATPYLYLDVSVRSAVVDRRLVVANSATVQTTELPLYARFFRNGKIREYYLGGGVVGDSFTYTVEYSSNTYGDPTAILQIDQVVRTDAGPTFGTKRQQIRTVEVAGSARTQGSLLTVSETSGLGDVVTYTHPADDELVPALRGFYVSGDGLVADPSTCSGARNYMEIGIPVVYNLPANLVTPGLYLVVVRVKSPGGYDPFPTKLTWSVKSKMGGAVVSRILSGVAPVELSEGYTFEPLGTVTLPPTSHPVGVTSNGVIEVSIGREPGVDQVFLDETYLFNISTGRVSIVSCDDSQRLWHNAATIANRTPTIMRGDAADGSDAYYAGDAINANALHEFMPPAAKVFTVATNALDADVSLSHFPRWLGHAAS